MLGTTAFPAPKAEPNVNVTEPLEAIPDPLDVKRMMHAESVPPLSMVAVPVEPIPVAAAVGAVVP
jgi:hypothetical protein